MSFVSVPLALKLLGQDRYGVWLTLTALLGWLSLADLGLANGLTNELASQDRNDRPRAQRALSSAFGMISRISLLMLVVSVALLLFAPWRSIVAAPEAVGTAELMATAGLCLGLFIANFWLGPLETTFAAYQEGYLLNYFQLPIPLVMLASLGACVLFDASMPMVVLALAGTPLLARLAGIAYMFGVRRRWLLPSRRHYEPKAARALLKTGFAFLVPQIAALAAWESDNLIVAQTFGAGAVATYATVFKLPMLFLSVLNIWSAPLWPAYAEAAHKGDIGWIKKTLRKNYLMWMGLSLVAGIGLVIVGPYFVERWTRGQLEATPALLIPMALYIPLYAVCKICSLPLNGFGLLKLQAYCGIAAAIVNVVLSVLLGRMMGLAGVVWASCIALLVPGVVNTIELASALRKRAAVAEAQLVA